MDSRRLRIKELLVAALELEPPERSSFLDRECDDETRAEVAALLEQSQKADVLFGDLEAPFDGAAESRAERRQLAAGEELSHYRILGLLGVGGMGEVYRARDTRLEREVAIKVLPAEFAEDEERLARFEREALVLASINHPNIATIHDIDQVGGVPFLVMELVDGETLAARLERGPLGLEEAAHVFRQLAEGTAAAHEKGIAHRDLKPANVVLDPKSRVRVLDFGIAKLCSDVRPVGEAAERSWTHEGRIIGTVPYMSPEQASGRTVDLASDIFSLGVLLHEMLSGELPFPGETSAEVIAAILRDAPRPLATSSVPDRLRRVLGRCLEKDTAVRYASAQELIDDLDAEDVEPLGATTGAWAKAAFSRPPVAVLPFKSLGDGPDDEYFADGITEDLITTLAYWRWFPVLASNSTFQYRNTDKSASQVAAELGARYLVDGSVRRSGDRVRIHAALVDASNGHRLWSQRFDRQYEDILDLQEEIAESIATSIEPELEHTEQQRSLRKRPENLDAWDLCLQALAQKPMQSLQGCRKAIAFLDRAIELDPDSSYALSMLSSCRYFEAIFGWGANSTTSFEESFRLAGRAVVLDERDWLAHSKLGMGYMWTRRDFTLATEEVQRAVALNPSAPQAYHCLSCVLGFSGEWAAAIPHLHTVLRLDPRYHFRSSALSDLALAHLMLRQLDESVDFAGQAIRAMPGNTRAHQRHLSALGHRDGEATSEDARAALLGIEPLPALEYFHTTYPFRHPHERAFFLEGLRAAGLELAPTA